LRVYFAYWADMEDLLKETNARVLISYANPTDPDKRNPSIPSGFSDVMIDSGAYSVAQKTCGRDVTVESYSFWLQQMLPKHPEVSLYANLDVVWGGKAWWVEDEREWNPEQGLKNLRYMEAQGLHPLPVWHMGESLRYLSYYCDNYEYVGIGGVFQLTRTVLKKNWEYIAQTYPNNKFHIFAVGMSAPFAFQAFQPTSIDNSSWMSPVRWGTGESEESGVPKHIVYEQEVRDAIRVDHEVAREKLKETILGLKRLETLDWSKLNKGYQKILL